MSAVPPWLIFSPRDPCIAVLPPVATKHQRRAKENAPAILAASHDRGLSPAAAFARIAKRRPVWDKSGSGGPKRTDRDVCYLIAFGGKADIRQRLPNERNLWVRALLKNRNTRLFFQTAPGRSACGGFRWC